MILMMAILAVIHALAISACRDDGSYIDPDIDGDHHYNRYMVAHFNKTPTIENCHVEAVSTYIDKLETRIDVLNAAVADLEDLTKRGIDNPTLPENDPSWFMELGYIAERFTLWMQDYEEIQVPIPLHHMHKYNLWSYVHLMEWKMDFADWLMDADRTEESLGDALTRQNEWGPKVQTEWESYHYRCGDVFDKHRDDAGKSRVAFYQAPAPSSSPTSMTEATATATRYPRANAGDSSFDPKLLFGSPYPGTATEFLAELSSTPTATATRMPRSIPTTRNTPGPSPTPTLTRTPTMTPTPTRPAWVNPRSRSIDGAWVTIIAPSPTNTPIQTPIPTPTNTPVPTPDVRDVDHVGDIEVPADFVEEATNIAVAYCDGRPYSADTLVLNHFGRQTVGGWHTYGFDAGSDDCRPDVLAAMAVRSKLMSLVFRRYIGEADGYLQCYDWHYTASSERLKRECPHFEELFPARHLPEYDREMLIVVFEDQLPEYPLDHLLTGDELWARSQIWRSLIRFFHYKCMDRAASAQGRTLVLFDRDRYIGYLPNLGIVDADIILPHLRGWGEDGPSVGLCSAYDIKVRAEHVMWERYDVHYFGYLANRVPAEYGREPGSVAFYESDGDLANLRANPPEMPNRFAAEGTGE